MPRLLSQVRAIPRELSRLPRSIKMIAVVIFLYRLSWAIFEPFLPIYFTEILGSYTSTTFVVAILYLFGMLWSFPIGEFIDRYSKRKWLRVMLLLYIPFWPWLALVRTIGHFVIFRLYHSFIATSLWGSADSYVRENSPDEHQSESVGLYDVGMAVALIVGSIIGGILVFFFDIRSVLVTVPIILMIAAYVVAGRLPEVSKSMSFKESVHSIPWRQLYRKELRDFWARPVLRRILIFSMLLGILGLPQMTLLPLLAHALGASSIVTGLLFALFAAPFLLEAPFSVLADRWSRQLLLLIGGSVAAVAAFGLFVSQSPIVLFPLVLLLGTASAMIRPVIFGVATMAMEHQNIGEMNAVYTASNSLGGFLALIALGPLADLYGIHVSFLVSGILMIVFLVFVLLLWPGIESRLKNVKNMAQ